MPKMAKPRSQAQVPSHFADAAPVPFGWIPQNWYNSFNAADSRLHRLWKNDSNRIEKRRAARESGRTRAIAMSIKPPAPLSEVMTGIMSNITPATSYPMSKRQLAYMMELNNQSKRYLIEQITEIRATCVKECNSNTNVCPKHSREVNKAWEDHYTHAPPGTWIHLRGETFIAEIAKLFAKETPIKQIHARVAQEFRWHTHDNLCTFAITDDDDAKELKNEAGRMFAAGKDEKDIQLFLDNKHAEFLSKLDPVEAEIQHEYRFADSEEEKYPVLRKWHCTPRKNDSLAMLKLRKKWDELFSSKIPYAQISLTIAKDIEQGVRAVKTIEDKIKQLTIGQNTQAKIKASKDEKKEEKDRILKDYLYSRGTRQCSGPGCFNLAIPINDSGDQIRCNVCVWLENLGHIDDAGAFCSMDCKQRLGSAHLHSYHPCASGPLCVNGDASRAIPEEGGNLCTGCWEQDEGRVLSYFCTETCRIGSWTEHFVYEHDCELPLDYVLKY